LVFGLLAAAFSLLAAMAFGLAVALGGGAPLLMSLTLIASLVAMGVGLGVPLAWAAVRSWQQRASPALRLPPAWWLGLIFVGLLVLGQLALDTPLNAILIPPLHVAVSLLPPLLIVAAITPALQRRAAGLTRRNLVTQFSYGGLAGVLLAILVEIGVVLGVLVAAGVLVGLAPGSQDNLLRLAEELQVEALYGDPMAVLRALMSPGIVLGLGLLVAAVIPLIEEFIKSLGAPINGVVQGRLTRAQAFAFGVIAGVGFSFVEALFYAAQQLPHSWATGVVLRSLTAVIHGAATGLFALGWYEVAAGRPARFLPYAAGGIAIHAVWNGLSGLTVVAGLATMDGSQAMMAAGGIGAILAVGLMAATWLAALAVLVVYTRRLGAPKDAAHAG
jgi:hypothetical protein